ncbi:MAG: hypothetical protein EA396_01605 [Anaerolineaceae bacterium]|nr:MAG: hypothetical protein EA396_01605 [Anaerolineaceae bacterium]
MTFSTYSFGLSDLQANRNGELSAQQHYTLRDYIDGQQHTFLTHLIGIGIYCAMFVVVMLTTLYYKSMRDDLFLAVLIIALLVGVLTVPYSVRQAMDSYQTVSNYRNNTVDQVTGVCHLYAAHHQEGYLLVTFADSTPLIISTLDDALLPAPGKRYTAYSIGDILLSFELA